MEYQSGNIFFRPFPLNKGIICSGHTHNFDHTTFFLKGRVKVTARDSNDVLLWEKEFSAGQWVLIKAEIKHELVGLEDDSEFVCIYAHRTPQGEVVQEFNGFADAYR